LLPVIQPHPPPDPLRQGQHFRIGRTEPEVGEPAADVGFQLADDGLELVFAVAVASFDSHYLNDRGHGAHASGQG
jgi:hypothetical protein